MVDEATVAIPTLGTTIEMNGQPIGQIMDITGPQLTTDTDEVTNHSSPDHTEEFIATIKRTVEEPLQGRVRDDVPGRGRQRRRGRSVGVQRLLHRLLGVGASRWPPRRGHHAPAIGSAELQLLAVLIRR
jgi:hypothetical protein